MCVFCLINSVDEDFRLFDPRWEQQQRQIVEENAQSASLTHGDYSGRLSDFDPANMGQSFLVSQQDAREFRLLGPKWGESQEVGTTGGLVNYSFATQNYNGQLRDFDSFITDNSFQKEIVEALSVWEVEADIRFTQVQDTINTDIRFGWANIDGSGSVLGETVFPSAGPLNQVIVAFDRAESWFVGGDAPANLIDFSSTAIHEIGHAIGIDHSETNQSIMRASYSREIFDLQIDDINAVTNIYGQNETVKIEVHRFYKPQTGSHFFTTDLIEKVAVEQNNAFNIEGVGFSALSREDDFVPGAIPVYRFFNSDLESHLFTAFDAEKEHLIDNTNFIFEGIGFRAFSVDTASTVPVYRFFNKHSGGHFFTASEVEKESIINLPQLIFEGEAFYAFI